MEDEPTAVDELAPPAGPTRPGSPAPAQAGVGSDRYPELGWRVLDAAPVVILVLDAAGVIQHVNPYFERLTGYRLDEVRGKDWFDSFLPARDRERIRTVFKQAFGGERVRGGVNPIVTRTGEQREIEWTDELLRDSDGRPTALLAIGHDVTERIAAQGALRDSEHRIAEAHRLANIGAWNIDFETLACWWSDEQYRIQGIPLGKRVTPYLFVSLLHPEDRVMFAQKFRGTLADGYGEFEYRIVRPDGEVRDVVGRAKTTYDGHGKPIKLAGTNQDITERKRTEEAARRSSELLRTVVGGAPVVMFALDTRGVFTLSEGRGLETLGLQAGALVGASALEIYAGVPGFVEAFHKALAGNQTVLTSRIGALEFEAVYAPSFDARGRIDGVVGVGFDVTERKQAEAQLRASEAKYRGLIEGADDMIYRMAIPSGRFEYVSPSAERVFGYSAEALLSDPRLIPRVIHPDFRESFEQDRANLQRGIIAPRTEYKIVDAWGHERWISQSFTAVRDPEGNVVAIEGICRDDTERKRTEAALRDSEQRYRTTVENLPDPLVLYAPDGLILYANPALSAMLRVPADQLVGMHAQDLWASDVGRQCDAMFERAVDSRTRQTEEIKSQRPGGAWAVRELTMVPLTGAGDQVSQVLTMSRDVTAQHQLVDELRDADRRKNEFLAVLSHELRNPVSAIRNGLDVVDEAGPGSDQSLRARALIARQVTQLGRMVDDLLDVSRITHNKIQLQRTRLDLDRLVHAVVDDHRALFASRGVRLELLPAQIPLSVNGDTVRLTQVIGNLLHNAVKFTPPGGATTLEVTSEAGRAVLRVTDTGAGIDPAMIPRIFEPFAQADRTFARSLGGLGLGLALVKKLLELHGGDVSVSSAGAGRGAAFIVRLPLERASEPTDAAADGTVPRASRRVLVIEDNLDAADSLRMLLELHGHAVEVAHDGPAGIELARVFRPDIVLSDLGLPGISGYDVARAFKHDDALRSVTMVAVSGYAAPAAVAEARAAGFDAHLAKPIDLVRLCRLIDRSRDL